MGVDVLKGHDFSRAEEKNRPILQIVYAVKPRSSVLREQASRNRLSDAEEARKSLSNHVHPEQAQRAESPP